MTDERLAAAMQAFGINKSAEGNDIDIIVPWEEMAKKRAFLKWGE